MVGAPQRGLTVRLSRWATPVVILAAAALCLALNFPGHFSYDSVVQLSEGRTGLYSGQHPPVMSWLLGIADRLTAGAWAFVVLDVALIYGSLSSLTKLGRPGWPVAVFAAAASALPQLLIYPAIVWKDVLFAGALLAGYACLARAAADWRRRPARRWAWLVGALVLLILAALARQNGLVALPVAALTIAWIAAREGDRTWRAGAFGLGFLIVASAGAVAASAALATRLDRTDAISQSWQALELGDLVAAKVRDPGLDLAVFRAEAPMLAAEVRSGVSAYSPVRLDTLEPAFAALGDDDSQAPVIARQWRELILRHPWLYLQVRASAFRWVLTTPRPDACGLIETGVEGPSEEMALSGLRPRQTWRDDVLGDYALGFSGTPAFSHVAYGLAAAATLAWLLHRRRPSDLAVAGLLASAFAFAGSFAVISIACDYRYLYALDIAAIAAALYLASSVRPAAGPSSPAKRESRSEDAYSQHGPDLRLRGGSTWPANATVKSKALP